MYKSLLKFSSVILFIAFTLSQGLAQSNSDVSLNEMFYDYSIQTIDSKSIYSKARDGGFFTVDIPKPDGGSWTVELHDSKVIGDNYLSQYADDQGIHTADATKAIATTGNVDGNLYTSVSLTFNDGFVYGFIKDKTGYNYIEPVSYFDASMKVKDAFVIYNEKDIKPTAPKTCGTTELHDKREEIRNHKNNDQRSVLDECYEVEWAIANDFLMFDNLGSVIAVENHAIGVANNVQTNYDNEFTDELQLIIVTQFTATTSASDPWTTSTDAGTLLNDFTDWGPGGFAAVHDVGSLWTNRNFSGSTIGIAWLGVVCQGFRYNCLEDFTNNANTKRVMVAHELGHNFDAEHDGSGSGFIMAPSVNNTVTWSSASISAIESHVASRWCLDNCSGTGGAAPTADFEFNVIDDCTVGEVVFTSSSSGSNLDYEWSFPGGVPASSTLANPAIQYPDPGTYDVSLTVTNANGTDVLIQNNIFTINPSPIVDYGFAIDGTVASFFNFTQFGSTYIWDFGDGQFSIESDPVHDYIDDGVYTVNLTATSICGDVSLQEIVVVANPPTADFTADVQEGCAPITVQYTSNASNNTDDYIWTFEGGNPATSTEENPSVTYVDAGDWDVTLTVINETGDDVLQETEYITVIGQPVSDFSYELNGSEVEFTNFSEYGEDYIWTFGDGDASTDSDPTHTYTEDGTYTVVLTVENECGSNTTSTDITISLAPLPSIAISGETEGCAPQVIDFESTSSNSPDSFAWTFEGGTPATSTMENPQVTYSEEGVYDVTLTVTNENGSNTETFTEYITIYDLPSTGFDVVENGLVAAFTDQSSGATSHFWSFGDGNSSVETNPTHTYASEGIYTVLLETTNDCGTTSESIVINNYTPVTASFASDITSGCADLEIEFSDQSSSNVTGWMWTFEGGTPATSTLQNPTVSYSAAGQYDVILTVSHPESSETITLTNYIAVSDEPVTSFEYFDDLFEVDFTNTTIEGTTYSWDFGDGTTSSMESPSHTYTDEGTYNVVLSATNSCGTTTASQMVVINALPTAAFNANNATGCGPLTVEFNNASSSNSESFAWTFEGGSPATSTDENPTVTYSTAGTYPVTLTVTSPAGTDINTIENFVVVIAEPTAEINTSLEGNIVTATNTGSGADNITWIVDGESFDSDALEYTFGANGTYSIELVTENECGTTTASSEVTIDVYPEADFGNVFPITACVGESITLEDNSTNVESKEWILPNGNPETSSEANPIVMYDAIGSYDVTLTVINTYGTSTETITGAIVINDLPTASFDGVQDGSTVSFTSTSVGANTYSWDFGDGKISDEMNPTYTYTENGTYEVILTVSNECGVVKTTATYTINVSAVTESDFNNMIVYPNPASDYITISVDNKLGDDINISIIDVQGRIVANEKLNSEKHTINTSQLLSGTYMLRLSSAESSYLKKIVILK